MREQIIYHLFGPNDLLIDTIQKIAFDNKIKKAVVLSFIGSAKKVSLSNLKDSKDKPEKSQISLEGTFEIISMTGHIIPVTGDKIRVHMHITLAKEDGSVFGGHLDEAILYTCLLYTSPSPRDGLLSRMPSSA